VGRSDQSGAVPAGDRALSENIPWEAQQLRLLGRCIPRYRKDEIVVFHSVD
jgi:hypothetical protein